LSSHPDDWDTHWTHQRQVASKNAAQGFRHRIVAAEILRLNHGRLLDIGSGQGDFLELMSFHMIPTCLSGLELSTTGVEVTRTKIPDADIRRQDLLDGECSILKEF